MSALLPLACFFMLFLVIQKLRGASDWRSSFLFASLVWGVILAAITEILSIFRLVGSFGILSLWILVFVVATLILIRLIRANGSAKSLDGSLCFANLSRFDVLSLASITSIIIVVGSIAWIAPPNNWDSMTYHMSRVVHWIQDGSVADYPTHIARQLYQNPWAEFAILHFQVLSGSDRFANLIQWSCMIGVTLGISLLAKQLGASLRGQIFAAAVSVTIPMGILQGSSTQNDYVVSFWLVCLAYFALQLKETGKPLYAGALGMGLGLALLTKATAYIYAFPFMAWISLSLLKSHHVKGLLLIGSVVLIAFVINVGFYSRNYDLYRNPLGPGSDGGHFTFANDIFTFSSVTSNAIRNIGLHLSTPFHPVNSFFEKEIYQLHSVIGISPNDPRTTWAGTTFHILPLSLHEDTAGNFLHLVFILVSTVLLFLQKPPQKDVLYYFVCLVGAFILFSIYPKWQPWNSRLHLPLFVLWSALIGLSFSQIKVHWIANLGILILLVGALPYLLENKSRPIIGPENIFTISRTDMYFANNPALAEPYIGAAQFLSKSQCSDIGIISGWDSWEYPFWVLLGEDGKREFRIEHVNVTNPSKVKYNEYPFKSFSPCAVIFLSGRPPTSISVGDLIYARQWLSTPVAVFMQK